MLYKTLFKVSHNGEIYDQGKEIELNQKEAEKLINIGAITKIEKQPTKKEN